MRLIRIDDLPAQPWKNKGGITREIAARRDEQGLLWRASVAEVERDGPFSVFPGADRILTVIEGAGLRLRYAAGVIEAAMGIPVRFAGDLAIDCELVDGPVRDFNMIFDAARTRVRVERLPPGLHSIAPGFGLLPIASPLMVSEFGVAPAGSFLRFDESRKGPIEITIGAEGAALFVAVSER